jgi:hypothetical protein
MLLFTSTSFSEAVVTRTQHASVTAIVSIKFKTRSPIQVTLECCPGGGTNIVVEIKQNSIRMRLLEHEDRRGK